MALRLRNVWVAIYFSSAFLHVTCCIMCVCVFVYVRVVCVCVWWSAQGTAAVQYKLQLVYLMTMRLFFCDLAPTNLEMSSIGRELHRPVPNTARYYWKEDWCTANKHKMATCRETIPRWQIVCQSTHTFGKVVRLWMDNQSWWITSKSWSRLIGWPSFLDNEKLDRLLMWILCVDAKIVDVLKTLAVLFEHV